MGVSENEGAKFWLSIMTELKNRDVQDVLIAVVDGLKGFPEAITAAAGSPCATNLHVRPRRLALQLGPQAKYSESRDAWDPPKSPSW